MQEKNVILEDVLQLYERVLFIVFGDEVMLKVCDDLDDKKIENL